MGNIYFELYINLILTRYSFAGFPEAPIQSTYPQLCGTMPWVPILQESLPILINSLNSFKSIMLYRDAIRFAFVRLASTLGCPILPYVPMVVDALLVECSASELVDILPFLGLLAHKFKVR